MMFFLRMRWVGPDPIGSELTKCLNFEALPEKITQMEIIIPLKIVAIKGNCGMIARKIAQQDLSGGSVDLTLLIIRDKRENNSN